jgi:thiamine pyrophosphate-dependent acetolactate synthase large subunit-like protein
MKVVQAIAQILKKEGVDFIIGYPVNPIIEAAAEIDIRTIIVRQERVGLHMADAVSRLTSGGTLGVFVMQHGPGTENAFGGVAQAFSESVPILVMPAGYTRRTANYLPNFNSTLNYRNVTKHAEPLNVGKYLPEVMRRGFAQLRNGRPGPVMVEVPWDVFSEEIDEPTDYVPSFHTRYGPDPAAVAEVAEVLAAAERPVIYAGQGVHYAKAWSSLKELAETMSIPVTTSIEGKSAFPENHPLALGCAGRSCPKTVLDFLQEADVVFGIGCSFSATAFGIRLPDPPTLIHATLDANDLNKEVRADYPLVGDAELTLQAVLGALKDQPRVQAEKRKSAVPQRIQSVREEFLSKWMPKLASKETPINPYRVIAELNKHVDKANTIITHDAGSPRDQMTPFWESTEPLSYIGWGKTTQLGYGLGLAMGAKLIHPDKLCINVWGDAAIGFTGMDFETAVRERIPILTILLNNFSMAIEIPIMKQAQAKFGSTDISGHYADMAKAFGGYGERVTDPNEIVSAIQRGIDATEKGQPALLEFITSQEIEFSIYKELAYRG